MHNHYEDGSFRYKYPSVQYKVIKNIPTLIGINEGAELLPSLFLKIKELDIDGEKFDVNTKNIELSSEQVGYSQNLHQYEFATLWMGLNQTNYAKYHKLSNEAEKQDMLNGKGKRRRKKHQFQGKQDDRFFWKLCGKRITTR